MKPSQLLGALLLLIACAAILHFTGKIEKKTTPPTLQPVEEEVVPEKESSPPTAPLDLVNHSLYFYNVTDGKDAIPVLVIAFQDIPRSKIPELNAIQKEIQQKMNGLGGIYEEADYGKKLSPLIVDYSLKLTSFKVTMSLIFPRQKQGMLLVPPKKLTI